MVRTVSPRLLAGAAILVLAAACTSASPSPSTQGDAEQALCDSLAAFGTSVQTIADFDPTTQSVDDLKADATAANDAWDQVKADAANVSSADDAALETAWTGLYDTITNFATDIPVADAKDQIASSVDDVQGVYDEMRNGLNCS